MSSTNSSDGVVGDFIDENTASRTLAPKAVAVQFVLMSTISVWPLLSSVRFGKSLTIYSLQDWNCAGIQHSEAEKQSA